MYTLKIYDRSTPTNETLIIAPVSKKSILERLSKELDSKKDKAFYIAPVR